MSPETTTSNENQDTSLERQIQNAETELLRLKSWLKSELGYDSNETGNIWRTIDETRSSLDRLTDTVWKGNGRPSLQDQIGQMNAKLNLIGAIAVLLSPLTVVIVEIVLQSIRH